MTLQTISQKDNWILAFNYIKNFSKKAIDLNNLKISYLIYKKFKPFGRRQKSKNLKKKTKKKTKLFFFTTI